MEIPPLHPEWLVKFWLTTPVINKIDPHLFSIIVLGILIFIVFVIYKKRKSSVVQFDKGEQQFQRLMKEKRLIEKRLQELEQTRTTLTKEEYEKKKKELERHLNTTTKELQQFI